jgi:hypothetical protein
MMSRRKSDVAQTKITDALGWRRCELLGTLIKFVLCSRQWAVSLFSPHPGGQGDILQKRSSSRCCETLTMKGLRLFNVEEKKFNHDAGSCDPLQPSLVIHPEQAGPQPYSP